MPAYIAVGAAAGLKRYLAEAEDKTLTPEAVLQTVSGLDVTDPLARMILENYKRIAEGCTVSQLLQFADEQKYKDLQKCNLMIKADSIAVRLNFMKMSFHFG